MSTLSRRDTRLQEQTKSLILTPPLPTQDRSPPRSYIVPRTSHNQNNYDSHSPQFKLTSNPLTRLFKSTGKSTNTQFRSDVKTSPWNEAGQIKDEKKRSLTPTSRQQYSTNVAEATREAEELKQTIVKMHQDLQEKEKNMKKIEGDLGSQTKYLLSKLEEQTHNFQEERRDLQQELNKSGEESRKIFLELTTKLRNIEEENAFLKSNIAHFQPYQGDNVLSLNSQVSRLEEQVIQLQQTQYQVTKLSKQDKNEGLKEQSRQIGKEEQLEAANLQAKIQSDMEQIRKDIQNSSSVASSKSKCTEIFERIAATIQPLFRNNLVFVASSQSSQVEGYQGSQEQESQKELFRFQQLFTTQKQQYELQISYLQEECESLKRNIMEQHQKSSKQQLIDQVNDTESRQFSTEDPKRIVNQSYGEDIQISSQKDQELKYQMNEKNQFKGIQAETGQDLNESVMQQQLQMYLQQMKKNVQQLAQLEGIVADLQTAIKKKESECEEKNKQIKLMQSQPGMHSKFRLLVKSFVESLQNGTKAQLEESLKQISENSVQDYDQLRNLSVQVLADREELKRLQNYSNQLSDSANKKRQEGREKELEDALRQQEIILLQFQEAKKQQDAEKDAAAKNIISLTQSLRRAQENISFLTQQNQSIYSAKQNNQQPLSNQQSLKSSINNSSDNSQVISDMPLPDSPKIMTAHQHSKRKTSNPLREDSQNEQHDYEIQRKLFHSEGQEEHYKLRCQELEKILEEQNYADTLNDFAKREINLKKEIEELKEECKFWKEEHQQCQQEVVNLTYNVEAIRNQLASSNSNYKGEDFKGRIAVLVNENQQLIQTKNQLLQKSEYSQQSKTENQRNQQIESQSQQQQHKQQSIQLNYASEQVQKVSEFQIAPLARSEGEAIRKVYQQELNLNQMRIQSNKETQHTIEEMKKQIDQLTIQRDSLTKKVEKLSLTGRQSQGDLNDEINRRISNLSEANEMLANENTNLNSKYRSLRDKISSLISLATGLQELTCSCQHCSQLKASITAGAKELAM